ncbi:hypothetical protein CKO51_21190 [Rhodopirellula sp. SM50]|nr:hypothetical protein CKO51_21190 [Rhodopirellula sp. SM50]
MGSQDQRLIDRLRSKMADEGPIAPDAGPRVKLCKNGDIYFNGVLVTWDEFIRQLGDPMWDGTELHEYTESFEMDGDWSNSGEFWIAVRSAMASWAGKGPRYAAWNLCSSEEKWMQSGKDELTDFQAAMELVQGTISRLGKSFAPYYGYGLEYLCGTLGSKLETIEGKNRLKSLRLETPLTEFRCPVSLPFYEDFPYISYIEADEVRLEWQRLSAADLSYRKSRLIEEDRRSVAACLQRADRKGCGIVSFYY